MDTCKVDLLDHAVYIVINYICHSVVCYTQVVLIN